MLTPKISSQRLLNGSYGFPVRQKGVVLIISLIILVALTIGGIALVRSVDTTNVIAGNLAFQQAATHAAEAGTAQAILYLESVPQPYTALYNDNTAQAYSASTPASGNPANWDAYWSTTIDPPAVALPGTCQNRVCTLLPDALGNVVSYTIQRLCATAGDPLASGCAVGSQTVGQTGGACLGASCVALPKRTQYYYRVTTRVAGPRNTTSYVQTIVAR